jgi:very-short-patch-repair endonuclease
VSQPSATLRSMRTAGDRALGEKAAAQHGVFTLADARNAGLTHGQIDQRVAWLWKTIHQGVFRMPGAVATWESEVLAACLAAKSQPAAASHHAAAALYGLPGARADVLEITCRRWKRMQKSGLVVHESTKFSAIDVTEHGGVPVVIPERLILELAGLWPWPDYIERVIQAARRKRLVTYDSTLETFQRLARRGVPGVRAMRAALERWNPTARVTHSDPEIDLVQILRDHGLREPVTQFIVLDEHGNFVAQTDVALPKWRVTVDYDSKQEHSDEFQLANDARRRNEIIAAGYFPLTARFADLRNGGHVLVEQILRVARRASA